MSSVMAIKRVMRRVLVVLSCLALLVWAVAPGSSHVPTVFDTLQHHAEVVSEHGHSHGFEEDLMWAMHGHSHDVADHDHTQAVLMPIRYVHAFDEANAVWRSPARTDWSHPLFLLERPPRA
ncbi:hypothetical protein [Ruegeria arenilitoris]|uniref:hypothetical protein n=1 Tax=Ruegeria arenilitoris TaxID=1173585 RepID=UPI00147AFB1E|nr:hypothetical protein [Ruegeria arenilitoris]